MFTMLEFTQESYGDIFNESWHVDTDNLDDASVASFIDDQKAAKTVKKTKSDLNAWNRWCSSVGQTKPIEQLSKEELNRFLSHFFIEVRKIDGNNYEPGSLQDFQRSLERHLQQNCGKKFSIIRDVEFENSRQALESKKKQLRWEEGKARKPNKAAGVDDEEMEKMWTSGQLGCGTPLSTMNTVWLNNGMHFGWRGYDEHYKLLFGDIALKREDAGEKREYLEWLMERGSKTRDGSNGSIPERPFNPKMFATGGERCPVTMYKKFVEHRPSDCCKDNDPFYLAIIYTPRTKLWYKNQKLGQKSLAQIMKKMATATGLTKRITNHSARRTMITTLKHQNVHPLDICQITVHSNPKSLDHYSEMSTAQQANVSHLISNRATAARASSTANPIATAYSSFSAKVPVPAPASIPTGTPNFWPYAQLPPTQVYNNCTFYAAPPPTDSPPRKHRRCIIYSSDEETEE